MDPREFACVVGLAVFVAQCVLRYAVARQSAKANAAFDAVLSEELSRLQRELVQTVVTAPSLVVPEHDPVEQVAVVRHDQSAYESRLAVGKLIEAERDARRARRDLDSLQAHKSAMVASLSAATAAPARSRMMLIHGIMLIVGLSAGTAVDLLMR